MAQNKGGLSHSLGGKLIVSFQTCELNETVSCYY